MPEPVRNPTFWCSNRHHKEGANKHRTMDARQRHFLLIELFMYVQNCWEKMWQMIWLTYLMTIKLSFILSVWFTTLWFTIQFSRLKKVETNIDGMQHTITMEIDLSNRVCGINSNLHVSMMLQNQVLLETGVQKKGWYLNNLIWS